MMTTTFQQRLAQMRQAGYGRDADDFQVHHESMEEALAEDRLFLDDTSGIDYCLHEGYMLGVVDRVTAADGIGHEHKTYTATARMMIYKPFPWHLPASIGAFMFAKMVSWDSIKSKWAQAVAQPVDHYGYGECFANGECPSSWQELFHAASLVDAEYGI